MQDGHELVEIMKCLPTCNTESEAIMWTNENYLSSLKIHLQFYILTHYACNFQGRPNSFGDLYSTKLFFRKYLRMMCWLEPNIKLSLNCFENSCYMKWSFHWKNYLTGYFGIYFSLERTSEYLVEGAILFRTTSLLQIFAITMLFSRVIFKVKSCCKNHSMTLIKIYRWHGKLMKEIIFKRWITDRIIIN